MELFVASRAISWWARHVEWCVLLYQQLESTQAMLPDLTGLISVSRSQRRVSSTHCTHNIETEGIKRIVAILMAYWTRRFNAAFTSYLQQSLSWAPSIKFKIFIPISSRLFLILSYQLILDLPRSLFPLDFPAFFHSCNMPCPSQSSRFNHPDYIRCTL